VPFILKAQGQFTLRDVFWIHTCVCLWVSECW